MNDSIKQQKAELRDALRAQLRAVTPAQRHDASLNACNRLMQLEAFKHASVVMLYMPLSDEIDLTPAALRCFQRGKSVCVPKANIARGDMKAVEVSSFDDEQMEKDELGVRSPTGGRLIVPQQIDLIIVPGVAFTAGGQRLGRGGGYYDRYLARAGRTATRIGLGFDFQVIDHVPTEPGDASIDLVVTDRRIAYASASRSRREDS